MFSTNAPLTFVSGIIFTQSTPSATWVISHGADNSAPIVDVWIDNGSGTKVQTLPETVTVTDSNTVTLTFTTPQSGIARVF